MCAKEFNNAFEMYDQVSLEKMFFINGVVYWNLFSEFVEN